MIGSSAAPFGLSWCSCHSRQSDREALFGAHRTLLAAYGHTEGRRDTSSTQLQRTQPLEKWKSTGNATIITLINAISVPGVR